MGNSNQNDTPTRASDEFLGRLHIAVAEHLTNRLASGEAEAGEVNAAIKFLKDNKIEALNTDPHMRNLAERMAKELPEFDSEDMDEQD